MNRLRHLPVPLRCGLLVGATGLAYHRSLASLLGILSTDTPLSYLGLVPMLALLILVAQLAFPRESTRRHDRRHSLLALIPLVLAAAGFALILPPNLLSSPLGWVAIIPLVAFGVSAIVAMGPDEHGDDAELDLVVGVALLATALVALALFPIRLSSFYWTWRLDLLSLPLYVAGLVAIIFGIGHVWRLRASIAFLLLAWPPPYQALVGNLLNYATDLTNGSLARLLKVLPLATVQSGDGSVFQISHSGGAFLVAVASECAGMSAFLGFFLAGLALMTLVQGRIRQRAIWLVAGLSLVWILNLARLALVFASGKYWGKSVALDGLHPLIGMTLFCLGVLVMGMVLPWFRLHGPFHQRPAGERVRPRASRLSRHHVAVLGLSTAIATVFNGGLDEFLHVASAMGAPRVGEFSQVAAHVPGWSLGSDRSYPWISQYMGADATWQRYQYSWRAGSREESPLHSDAPVILDVISTSDLARMEQFGVEACYRFHSYQLLYQGQDDLGGGVTGHSIVYRSPERSFTWTAEFWEWPVATAGGQRYERLVLNMVDLGDTNLQQPASTSSDPLSSLKLLINDPRSVRPPHLAPSQEQVRIFLGEFARKIVSGETLHAHNGAS